VRLIRYFALVIFYLDLPVPIYWLVLHPFSFFWRRRIRTAFWVAGLGAWTVGLIILVVFRDRWLAPGSPSILVTVLCVAFVAADFTLLTLAARDLGNKALVGHAELSGKMTLTTSGMYKYLRHPRYAGMMLSMAGACLLAGTSFAWAVGAVWLPCVLACILLEERELRRRFGPSYLEYCRAVPRFIPRIRLP
jgi:protein-S-isoprenylcysteine O-methyltransferase Ste14